MGVKRTCVYRSWMEIKKKNDPVKKKKTPWNYFNMMTETENPPAVSYSFSISIKFYNEIVTDEKMKWYKPEKTVEDTIFLCFFFLVCVLGEMATGKVIMNK